MLKYMYDYYVNNYEWFMCVEDFMYLKLEKFFELFNSVNSLKDVYFGCLGLYRVKGGDNGDDNLYFNDKYCYGGIGIVFLRSVLMKFVFYLENCLENVLME